MIRVFRWDGKEVFINPDLVMFVEKSETGTDAYMVDGEKYKLSLTSYEILTEHTETQRKPGKAGFEPL